MARLEIWVIGHRGCDLQPRGEIIQPWDIYPGDAPGDRYADFCALHHAWTTYNGPADHCVPEMIGFFGYRKYLLTPVEYPKWTYPAHAVGWRQCSKSDFDDYRNWLSKHDGADFKRLLAEHDILQAAPFALYIPPYLMEDFAASRSSQDASRLGATLDNHGWKIKSRLIYPYIFITRWSVFNRMMRELEPIRQELDPMITAEDSSNDEYKKRPMAYIMERVYSLWLEQSGLDIEEMPLLHCWDM